MYCHSSHMYIHPYMYAILSNRFRDSKGVNYLEFLEQLQPSERLEDKYQSRMTQLSTRKTLVCYVHSRTYIIIYIINNFNVGSFTFLLLIAHTAMSATTSQSSSPSAHQ